jgi:hypothetical protein
MLLPKVLHQVVEIAQPIVKKIEVRVKAWEKPATDLSWYSIIVSGFIPPSAIVVRWILKRPTHRKSLSHFTLHQNAISVEPRSVNNKLIGNSQVEVRGCDQHASV